MAMNNEKPLKKVIDDMLEAYKLKGKINEVKIMNAWEGAVGKMVAMSTEKMYVRKGKLYVYLNSSVIKNELLYARAEIIKRLNETVGENVIEEMIVK